MIAGIVLIIGLIGLAFWIPPKGKPVPPWFSVMQTGSRIMLGLVIILMVWSYITNDDPPTVVTSSAPPPKSLPMKEEELVGCWHYHSSSYDGYIYFNQNKKFIFTTTNGNMGGIWRVDDGKINLFYKEGSNAHEEIDPTDIDSDRKSISDGYRILKWFSSETDPKISIIQTSNTYIPPSAPEELSASEPEPIAENPDIPQKENPRLWESRPRKETLERREYAIKTDSLPKQVANDSVPKRRKLPYKQQFFPNPEKSN